MKSLPSHLIVVEADGFVEALEDGAVAPTVVDGLTLRHAVNDSAFVGVAVVPVEGSPSGRPVVGPAADVAVAIDHGLRALLSTFTIRTLIETEV